MSAPDSHIVDSQSSALGMLARLWWMFLGNAVLAFSILLIVKNRGGFFHAADWIFWITMASLVLIRYVDIKFLNGCTVTDARASITHWIRYAAILTAGSAIVWALAHAASYLLTTRAAQSP